MILANTGAATLAVILILKNSVRIPGILIAVAGATCVVDFLDLAIRSPRQLFFWLACCAGLGAAFFGLTQVIAGGTFIDHLMSPRIFTWYGVRYHLMKYLRLFKFPLIAIALLSPMVFSDRRIILASWGIVSIAAAAIFSGFEGTSYNMFQDAAVFLGIAAGVAFHELCKRISARRLVRGRFVAIFLAVMLLFLAQPIFARSTDAFLRIYDSRGLLELNRRAEEAFLNDARFISESDGSAFCESLLLCYVAGQPFILDPFNSRQ